MYVNSFMEKPSLEILAHVGVKGMKWGVRKAKPTTDEIKDARRRQEEKERKVENIVRNARKSNSQAAKNAAIKKADKIVKEYNRSEDKVTAARMTRGEKAAALIVGGPFGLVVIGANKVGVKQTEKNVDKARARS